MRFVRSTVSCLLLAAACDPHDPPPDAAIGTTTQRAELLARVRDQTSRREAFSPVKNQRLDLDVLAEMDALAPEFASARTDVDLFYALVELSGARRDRHLSVQPVDGGLVVPGWDDVFEAPLRFAVDYGTPDAQEVFVTDVDPSAFDGRIPTVGDQVVAVNGQPLADYAADMAIWYRWSTVDNLWWHVAEELGVRSSLLPPDRFSDGVTYTLRGADGATWDVSVPYLPPDEIRWSRPPDPVYPDLALVFTTPTYALYRHIGGRDVVLLRWLDFGDTLVDDVDRLMRYAEDQDLLHQALIVDATASSGGSRGVYALSRMTGRPFRSTFGNLRLSDVVPAFVDEVRDDVAEGESEGDDGGERLLAWLEGPVMDALEAGEPYSDDVPFKLAYLPPDSDGTIFPAEVHFDGPLVAFFGPAGGSHLDQFSAMIHDNALGYTIGMPTGGYSNTWEWSEVLTMPGTGRPLAEFMWSIGQTIRPNGEVLEGNPADVDERVPQTAENWPQYHALLLERAYAHLDRPEESEGPK